MLVLALDTTTRQGSVALARGEALLDCYTGDAARTHGERLPGDLMHVLQRQQVSVHDVDLFAIAAGPGPFTGLRIGIATLQGLALANERSLVGVSALDALNAAVQAIGPSNRLRQGSGESAVALGAEAERMGPAYTGPVLSDRPRAAVWMDAQRGEVFSALYDGTQVIDGPSVEKPADVLARWQTMQPSGRITFVGEGAAAYAEIIRREMRDAEILVKVPPLAPSIARLALDRWLSHGPSTPDAIRPIYVRRPDAELARDRAAQLSPHTQEKRVAPQRKAGV